MNKLMLSALLISTINLFGGVINITSEADFNNRIQSGVAVVDFYADWCNPCKVFSPTFSQLSNDFPTITFIKVNIEKFPAIASRFAVRSIPTLIVFKDGSKVARPTDRSKSGLTNLLNNLCPAQTAQN